MKLIIKVMFLIPSLLIDITAAEDGWFKQSDNSFNIICFASKNIGWGMDNSGTVYKTEDGGANWSEKKLSNSDKYNMKAEKREIDIFCVDQNTCFFAWYNYNPNVINPYLGQIDIIDGGKYAEVNGPMTNLYFLNYNCGWVGISTYVINNEIHDALLLYTANAGENWDITSDITGMKEIRDFHVVDKDNIWVVGEGSIGYFVAHTEDGGVNWGIKTIPNVNYLYSLFFIDDKKGCVVGNMTSNDTLVALIINTTDAGQTWNKMVVEEIQFVNSVYFANSDVGYALGRRSNVHLSKILKTYDGGLTWKTQTTLETTLYCVDFIDPNIGWACGASELLKTTNGGETIAIENPFSNYTNNITLLQNSPNPVKKYTTIKYHLNKPNYVSLGIYNSHGELIKTLVNRFYIPGVHSVQFTPNKLPNGTYFYKLKAGSFVRTNKMLIMR